MLRFEANLDGLVGPTHNYAGLGLGNMASVRNRGRISNPRAAALQGLDKMRRLHDLGLRQLVMPPLPRPDLDFLRRLGFSGDDTAVVDLAWRAEPALLAAAFSASSMWTANAATVSPSADAPDGRVHFTPANLASQVHRSLETAHTARLLRAIFRGRAFVHHDPLPAAMGLCDEGAANHTRFSGPELGRGVQLFAYGRDGRGGPGADGRPRRHVPRQDFAAAGALARRHGLAGEAALVARQSAAAVDAGVFHNDVISTGHEDFFLVHGQSFQDTEGILRALRRAYRKRCGRDLRVFKVPARDLTLAEAVTTYLFNSQIVTLPERGFLLLAAAECRRHPRARRVLQRLVDAGLVARVEYADLRQSMRNGGGPACLRLRVELTEGEWAATAPGFRFDAQLHGRLRAWVEKHYRDRLAPGDLRDPELRRECRRARAALSSILGFEI